MEYLVLYLIIINLIAFLIFRADKKKSEKKLWRVKESTLLSFSLLGGGIGSLLAMKIFRHKTQKRKFTWGVPLLTLISIIILYFILQWLAL